MRCGKIETKVFSKKVTTIIKDESGQQTTKEIARTVGFLEYLSDDIRKMMAHYTKVSLDKWNVKAKEFSKVMAFIDSVNSAAWDVDSVESTKLDRYNVLAAWEPLFCSPRDVRFTDNRLSSPNIVVADKEEVDTDLSRAEFNAYVDDINSILKSGNGTVALAAEVNVEGLDSLKERPLFTLVDGHLRIYCRCDASEMKAPVFVDSDVAFSLYGESKWDCKWDEFKELFLEALRLKLRA